jgi:hypothetical protein
LGFLSMLSENSVLHRAPESRSGLPFVRVK